VARQFFIPPTVSNIRRLGTIKQSTIYTAQIAHHGRPSKDYQFVGPAKGYGPVTILGQGGRIQTQVLNPGMYGRFGPDWIINYFTEPH
jgi:hypothetical protein